VLIYLDPDTAASFLSQLAAVSGPGNRLAASLAVHEEGLPTERVVAAANARRRAGETEPWRTILPQRAHLTLLQRAGWHAERTFDAADLEETAMPGRTLLVRADLG
jgi:O-methyltransferase involved in polyketide biosynthesis